MSIPINQSKYAKALVGNSYKWIGPKIKKIGKTTYRITGRFAYNLNNDPAKCPLQLQLIQL